jgi:hypothetical protein
MTSVSRQGTPSVLSLEGGRAPVSVPAVHEYGPYTLYDLDALPEDGKRCELADGWLTELSPSPWHDHAAGRLKDILKNAARLAGAQACVAGGPRGHPWSQRERQTCFAQPGV